MGRSIACDPVARIRAVPGVLCALAGALALFGGVGLWGVTFPLATLPTSVGGLSSALLELASSLRGVLGFSVGRLDEMIAFLERLTTGDLALLMGAVAAAQVLVGLGAMVLGLAGAWRGRLGPALVGAAACAVDVACIAAVCGFANSQLYLALHSLAQGNPWAVGRGVAGLPAELAPSAGLWVALALSLGVLGVCVGVLWRERANPNSATAGSASAPTR